MHKVGFVFFVFHKILLVSMDSHDYVLNFQQIERKDSIKEPHNGHWILIHKKQVLTLT